ncbi:hypothetical protein ACFL5O_07760 [Myxococcota bacterium]
MPTPSTTVPRCGPIRVVRNERPAILRAFGGQSVLLLSFFLPLGFSYRDLRPQLAAFLGLPLAHMTADRMTYDLRRLRLHGLIRRIPGPHRYELPQSGLRIARWVTRVYCRILRPGLSQLVPVAPAVPPPIGAPRSWLEQALDPWREQVKFAA